MWIAFLKEVTELLRDKRTLRLMVIFPILIMPIMLGGFSAFSKMKIDDEARRVLHYAVFHIDAAPELDQRLLALPHAERRILESESEILEEIKDRRLDFAVSVPDGFEAKLDSGIPVAITLEYNDAVSMDTVRDRLRALVDDYTAQLRKRFLAVHGLDMPAQAFAEKPISLIVKSTANERERLGELLGPILAYFLLLFGMQAAMASAADVGAGEKERGTLESLLLLPFSRGQLVLAKFAAVTSIACLTSILSVTSLAVWGLGLVKGAGVQGLDQIISGIHASDFVMIAFLVLPANAIIAALLLSLSLFARSYKEATSYSAMVMALVLIPILMALAPNMRLQGIWAWVPITNVALAIKEILKGTLNMGDLTIVILSTVCVAGALLKFTTEWCKKESVLFRN